MNILTKSNTPHVNQIEFTLDEHFSKLLEMGDDLDNRVMNFHRDGYTKFKINEFVPEEMFAQLRDEVFSLVTQSGIRRDMLMPTTSDSPRYMTTVPQQKMRMREQLYPP